MALSGDASVYGVIIFFIRRRYLMNKGRTTQFTDGVHEKKFEAIEILNKDGSIYYLVPLWVKTPPKSWIPITK